MFAIRCVELREVFFICGGGGGIRTPDALASMPHFECGTFNRSATPPRLILGYSGGMGFCPLCFGFAGQILEGVQYIQRVPWG